MEEENESPQVIRVVTKLPNEEAKAVEIKNDYRTISDFCKGMIDMVDHPKDQHISIICNDEFLFNGMEPNIVAPEREEVFCGPLIFCGYDPETGDSISLTEEQVDTAIKYCKRNMLHHMSLEGAFQYAKVIGPLQKSYDELGIDETQMEAC